MGQWPHLGHSASCGRLILFQLINDCIINLFVMLCNYCFKYSIILTNHHTVNYWTTIDLFELYNVIQASLLTYLPSICDKFLVPRTFLSVVAARRRVEWLKLVSFCYKYELYCVYCNLEKILIKLPIYLILELIGYFRNNWFIRHQFEGRTNDEW